MIGIITGDPWLGRAKNGEGIARYLQVQFSGDGDVRTVMYMPQFGDDAAPIRGSRALVLDVASFLVAVAIFDGQDAENSMGEREVYSQNAAGQKLASLVLKDTGHAWLGNKPSGKNLRTVLQNLIQGIQGATFGGYPCVDATGKIAAALTDLASVLDATP